MVFADSLKITVSVMSVMTVFVVIDRIAVIHRRFCHAHNSYITVSDAQTAHYITHKWLFITGFVHHLDSLGLKGAKFLYIDVILFELTPRSEQV